MKPLAIKDWNRLVVKFNDKIAMVNGFLLSTQKAWKNAEAIMELHYYRFALHELMTECPKSDLPLYNDLCDGLEMCLQDLWGFSRDSRFIRFWCRPRCQCPKLDNDDAYPTGCYAVNKECPLHGK